MKTDIGIWEIDRSSRAGTKLRLTERVETEEMLEAVLVANPAANCKPYFTYDNSTLLSGCQHP